MQSFSLILRSSASVKGRFVVIWLTVFHVRDEAHPNALPAIGGGTNGLYGRSLVAGVASHARNLIRCCGG
jgi:hypothetical protein